MSFESSSILVANGDGEEPAKYLPTQHVPTTRTTRRTGREVENDERLMAGETNCSVKQAAAGAAEVGGAEDRSRAGMGSNNQIAFKSVIDPRTGEIGWKAMDEEYDYEQEISRSGYGDMLYDTDRNIKYEMGLKSVIKEKLDVGQRADVLDIGTGTGLLSLFAKRHGATSVTAIEAFPPMMEVAKKVTSANGHSDIRVISSRSTDLSRSDSTAVPHRESMHREQQLDGGEPAADERESFPVDRKPNICVAEVFDTELIGEGALRTFKHALSDLLAPNARVVPSRAQVRVMPFQSDWLQRWERPPAEICGIKTPPKFLDCRGNVCMHDLQLDQIPRDSFKLLLKEPIDCFRFNFEDADSIRFDECWEWSGQLLTDGGELVDDQVLEGEVQVDGVFYWWDLDMDGNGGTIISTQPSFVGKDYDAPWRDHWLGGITYFNPIKVKRGETLRLYGVHDEYSIWFKPSITILADPNIDRPLCSCGLHLELSRSSLFRLSDERRYQSILTEVRRHLRIRTPSTSIDDKNPAGSSNGSGSSHGGGGGGGRSVCAVTIGDTAGTLLPFVIAKRLTRQQLTRVYHLGAAGEAGVRNQMILNAWTAHNEELRDRISFIGDIAEIDPLDQIDIVICDPGFKSSLLPWHDIQFWFKFAEIKARFPSVKCLPKMGELRCLPVKFKDLWKIRAEVGMVEGFDLCHFDSVAQRAMNQTDDLVEPQPVWEYPCSSAAVAKSVGVQPRVQTLLTFAIESAAPVSKTSTLQVPIWKEDNGICFWMEWLYGDNCTLSTGVVLQQQQQSTNQPHDHNDPLSSSSSPNILEWNPSYRQGVYFIPSALKRKLFKSSDAAAAAISITCQFEQETGEIHFHFEPSI